MFNKGKSVYVSSNSRKKDVHEISARVLDIISGDVVLIEIDAHEIDPIKHGFSAEMDSYVENVKTNFQVYTSSAREAELIMEYPDLAFYWLDDSDYNMFRVVEETSPDGVKVNIYHIKSFIEFVEIILLTNYPASKNSDFYDGYSGCITPGSIRGHYTEFIQEYDNDKGDGIVRQSITADIGAEILTCESDRVNWAEFGDNGNALEYKVHYNNQIYDLLAMLTNQGEDK